MALLHTITHPSRLHDVKFCKRVNGFGELLFAGAEDKKLSIYHIPDDSESTDPPQIIAEMVGHSNRVKAVETLQISLPEQSKNGRKSTTIVCTVSSDGKIFIFDLASLPEKASKEILQIHPKAEYDTKGTRLTCVTIAEGEVVAGSTNGKRKRTSAGEESGEEDDEEDWTFGAPPDDVEEESEGEEEGQEENASQESD